MVIKDKRDKVNISAFVIALIGLIIIGAGSIRMLDAKIGTFTLKEYNGCEDFTRELVKSRSEYLKFDPEPYTTCKDGVLKRNYFDGIKVAVIGGVIILGSLLVKVFFIK